ncbi:MAG: DUF1565 domain-containing protein, partial [Erysipelothrix sp.]|nr:DUF1565 domain-containing protein [Erysipelothrix sp.]
MKKLRTILTIIAVVFLVMSNVTHSPVKALGTDETIYVNATADETTVPDGSITAPYKTIQAAIDAADEGSTIQVAAGTYRELLDIDKEGLTLKGSNTGVKGAEGRPAPTTIMFPESITNTLEQSLVTISADGVTFDGFDIINIVDNPAEHIGYYPNVYLAMREDVTFINNFVDSNADYVAVGVYGSEGISKEAGLGGILVANNTIRSTSGWSTLTIYAIGATVEDNVIIGGLRGLQVQVLNDTVGGVVRNNTISAYSTPVYHNYANVGSALWTYENNTLLGEPETNEYRGSGPDTLEWTGFFIENFGAEHYSAVGMPTTPPSLAFKNNVIDGQDILGK